MAGRLFLKRRRPFGFAPFGDVLEGFASLGEDRCYPACKIDPLTQGIGVQNSYDRLQVVLARLISPSRDAARVSVCREAEVRTPA